MGSLPSHFPTEFPRLTITAVIDILVVATLIYQFILIVRGRRAAHIVVGVIVLVFIYLAAISFRLELLRTLLATLAPYTAFALIVVFQSDVRRVLARIGRHRFFGFSELERREVADEILLAMTQLSQQRIGALIVVERNIGLRTFVESGVNLDARISRDLLLAIFHPKAPLHDGAVIVHGGRIVAAAAPALGRLGGPDATRFSCSGLAPGATCRALSQRAAAAICTALGSRSMPCRLCDRMRSTMARSDQRSSSASPR